MNQKKFQFDTPEMDVWKFDLHTYLYIVCFYH